MVSSFIRVNSRKKCFDYNCVTMHRGINSLLHKNTNIVDLSSSIIMFFFVKYNSYNKIRFKILSLFFFPFRDIADVMQ